MILLFIIILFIIPQTLLHFPPLSSFLSLHLPSFLPGVFRLSLKLTPCSIQISVSGLIGADSDGVNSAPSSDPLQAVNQTRWLLDESYGPLRGSKGSGAGAHSSIQRKCCCGLGMCLLWIYLMDDWIKLWQLMRCSTRGSCAASAEVQLLHQLKNMLMCERRARLMSTKK